MTPIQVKSGTAEGHVGRLGRAKFHADQCTGVGTPPPKLENFHFLVKICPPGANHLTDFYNSKGILYAKLPCVFQIWRDSLHGLRANCWETARRLFTPKFSVGKNKRWIENDWHRFNGIDVLYQHAKFGNRTTRAGCRCENVVFVFSVTLRSGSLCVPGLHSSNNHSLRCVLWTNWLIILIRVFTCFFPKWSLFRSFIFVASFVGATIFAKLRSKIAKSPKVGHVSIFGVAELWTVITWAARWP